MKKLLKVADLRKRLDAYHRDEISYSMAVHLLNQDINKRLGKDWISVKERPLVINGDHYWQCTEDGSKEFMAAVPYSDTNKPGQLLWWIRYCLIEDEVGLCVIGDTENESCGWEVDHVEYWMPVNEPK